MKSLMSVIIIVAVQGIGVAQQNGVINLDPNEVMKQMKSQDTFGIFGRGRKETLSSASTIASTPQIVRVPYHRGITPGFQRIKVREPEPINETRLKSVRGILPSFRVLDPVNPPKENSFSLVVEKKEKPLIGDLGGIGFRELTGYEKLRAIQEAGLVETEETTVVEDEYKSYSFSSEKHPLQLDVFPLGKHQALSYSDEPVQTIRFKDTSVMPRGGIVVNTSEGPVFLRYNVLCALSKDGTKRAIAVKKWDEVKVWVAEVVEIPPSSR